MNLPRYILTLLLFAQLAFSPMLPMLSPAQASLARNDIMLAAAYELGRIKRRLGDSMGAALASGNEEAILAWAAADSYVGNQIMGSAQAIHNVSGVPRPPYDHAHNLRVLLFG